jgi:hypothetical protein
MASRTTAEAPSESQIWIAVILVITIGVAGLIYFESVAGDAVTSMATAPPVHTSSSSEISTAGWSTITEGGYTIEYPADFMVQKLKTGIQFAVPIKSYFNTILPGEVYFSLNAPAKKCPASAGDSVTASSVMNAGGVLFIRNEWSGVGAGQLYRGIDYVTIKNGLCYDISLYTHSANGAGFYFSNQIQIDRTDSQHAADMKAFFQLSDKMVGTLQF